MVGLLTALPRTPLYERLEREGRLIADVEQADNTKLATNVMPKRMGYDEMIGAYKRLYHRLLTDRGIAERIRHKLAHLGPPVYDGEYAPWQRVAIVLRLLRHGILPGGTARLYQFLRTVPWRAPRKMPLMIVDWIAGLAMRDYVRRYFEHATTREQPLLNRRLAAMRALLADHLRSGRIALVAQAARVELKLSLDGLGGRRLFARLARQLDALLALRGATLTLSIERLLEREGAHVERLLERLAHHGDRIFVVVNEQLRGRVRIDSSRFNVVLA
jgi:hypothetical protein